MSQHAVRPRQWHLPCPRLELVWNRIGSDWTDRECLYNLVIPLKPYDIRANDEEGNASTEDTEMVINLGHTKCGGGRGVPPVDPDGNVDTPYRDGVHAKWDSSHFGDRLPVVAICENKFTHVK